MCVILLVMGVLHKTKTYLIGHMQYSDGRGWRADITPELAQMGITTFDPYHKPFIDDTDEDETARTKLRDWMSAGKYDEVAARMKLVRNFDLRLVDLSDFLIAHIHPAVASWGSAEEIVTAVRSKKPVFIAVEGGKKATPLWILGMVPHKYIYNNVEEIVNVLKKIDNGEKIIDNDRWKLLKEEYR